MSKNRVIGVDGEIPWRLPEDRKMFKNLTRDKILVIGRKTFEEEPTLRHIDHTRHCIVVSKTLQSLTEHNGSESRIKLVNSFQEALNLAKVLMKNINGEDDKHNIFCWIGGGERMYEEALRHPNAEEIHLSVVDKEIEVTRGTVFFPARHRWDQLFREQYKEVFSPKDKNDFGFTYYVYKRNRRS